MLIPRTLNLISTTNEAVVEKQFNKLRYSVRRLDRNARRPRPDFLILNTSGHPEMLCEVKTVHSAGYLKKRDAHISTLDGKLFDAGIFEIPIDLTKIRDNLADAVRKREALVEDDPGFAELPLLVAFFFDFFADHLVCYPRIFDAEVSGILTIEKDIPRTKAFGQLSTDEQEQRLKTGHMNGLPPNSTDFFLIRNKAARLRLPRAFQGQCFTEGFDESA